MKKKRERAKYKMEKEVQEEEEGDDLVVVEVCFHVVYGGPVGRGDGAQGHKLRPGGERDPKRGNPISLKGKTIASSEEFIKEQPSGFVKENVLMFNTQHSVVCIVLAAGSEIQANLRFNIFTFFLQFMAFTRGVLGVHFWIPPP